MSPLVLGPTFYRLKYALYAPFYDWGTRFAAERQRSVELLDLRPDERLVVIGGGSGRDLDHLPAGIRVVFTDYSPAMLRRAQRRSRARDIVFHVMDGRQLQLGDDSCDAAMLHMVLEVMPEPARCLAEAWRVLRVGGRLAVFDKFLPENHRRSRIRSAVAKAIDPFFTTTTLRFGELLEASGCAFAREHDEPRRGSYRVILLRKRAVGA